MTDPNRASRQRLDGLRSQAEQLRIRFDARRPLVDFGVHVPGGLQAGLELATLCLGELGTVSLRSMACGADPDWPAIQVYSDQPAAACMGCQYGGWPVQGEGFFAIGSGPVRMCRGREPVLEKFNLNSAESAGLAVLESAGLPDDAVLAAMREECGWSAADSLAVCVAPTRSLAGCIQIVARSLEATMHKLYELDFDLELVTSGLGLAPLPPVAADDLTAIGRTNDAILYGARVRLWVSLDDQQIQQLGPRVPSAASPDHGRPFGEIFEASGGDFYKLDPLLFSAAEVTMISNHSGSVFRFGASEPEIVARSFGLA